MCVFVLLYSYCTIKHTEYAALNTACMHARKMAMHRSDHQRSYLAFFSLLSREPSVEEDQRHDDENSQRGSLDSELRHGRSQTIDH